MKKTMWLCLITFLIFFPSCYSHQYKFGSGPQSGIEETYTQWYAIWGVLPIGAELDAAQIANSPNYMITSEFTFLDFLISIPGTAVSIGRRTVIIEK